MLICPLSLQELECKILFMFKGTRQHVLIVIPLVSSLGLSLLFTFFLSYLRRHEIRLRLAHQGRGLFMNRGVLSSFFPVAVLSSSSNSLSLSGLEAGSSDSSETDRETPDGSSPSSVGSLEEKHVWNSVLSLNDLVHEPTRMAILFFLVPRHKVKFQEIRKALKITAGNLSTHLKRLESHQLVRIEKVFIDLKPATIISLTERGRKEIQSYASMLSQALNKVLDQL